MRSRKVSLYLFSLDAPLSFPFQSEEREREREREREKEEEGGGVGGSFVSTTKQRNYTVHSAHSERLAFYSLATYRSMAALFFPLASSSSPSSSFSSAKGYDR